MRRLAARTILADTWVGRFGLALIATGTALFFALPLRTFETYPLAYRLMASLATEGQWAAGFAAVAAVTWAALWVEARPGRRGEWVARAVFTFAHGPLWFFVGWSAISATPAAYFPWWSIAAFVLAEWAALQPAIARWYGRRAGGAGGE